MIQPLRKRNAEGKPYVRRPEVEAELARLDSMLLTDILGAIQSQDEKVSSESLIYLLRREVRNETSQSPGVDGLIAILVERSELILKRHINPITFDEIQCEEILREVIDKLIDNITDVSDKADYAEVNFNHWLQNKRRDACDRQTLKIKRLEKFGEELDNLGDEEAQIIKNTDYESAKDRGPTPVDSFLQDEANHKTSLPPLLEGAQFTLDDQYRIAAVLNDTKLPQHILEAFLLQNYYGLQIDSKFPDEHTLVRHFGKSEKTIRNWLKQAESAFKNQRGQSHEYSRDESQDPGLGAA